MIQIFNRTKIIATIGPASSSYEMLEKLVDAGVNVFRLNFSHGTHEEHLQVIEHITKINNSKNTKVAILADLQGPKIRIGNIEKGSIELVEGNEITFTTKPNKGSSKKVNIQYDLFPKDVKKGESILVDDGKIELEVVKTDRKTDVLLKVIHGGILKPKKGVNLPNTKVSAPSLTEKDKKDLEFAIHHNANWVALSFVRTAKEMDDIKKKIHKVNRSIKVIAKIEKPEAIENIDSIIKSSDGIMIARGDLGVEVPFETMSIIQKDIVKKCIQSAKPVIIATQIMESMIDNPKPSRAEISDLANAVFDGADAVMLSGETAVGKFPVKVIDTMNTIIARCEQENEIYYKNVTPNPDSKTFLSDAICYNAGKMAEDVDAKVIIGMTQSGYTAFRISSYRPKAMIVIFTNNEKIIYALSMIWGVRVFHYDQFVSTDDTIIDVNKILVKEKLVKKGDIVINTGTMPISRKARTNMIKITKIE